VLAQAGSALVLHDAAEKPASGDDQDTKANCWKSAPETAPGI
jgi:hypothetical protein